MKLSRSARKRSAELPIGDGTAVRRRMLLIVNPFASTVSDHLKNVVIYALQSRYEVEAVETEDRNHAIDICRRAIDHKHEVVVAFGGDGTANEVANGMAGTDIPVAFLPGGMTSVIARNMGMPLDTIDATEHLLTVADRWEPRKIDLGEINGRKFLFCGGAGFDAEIVKQCEARPALKARFGQNLYIAMAARALMRDYLGRKPRMTVRCGELESRASVVVAQNSAPFTYIGDRPLDVCAHADPTNGSLALTVLDRMNAIDFPSLVTRFFSRRLSVAGNRHVKAVDAFQIASIRADEGRRVPVQVDGDYIGDFTDITLRACPGALTIVT